MLGCKVVLGSRPLLLPFSLFVASFLPFFGSPHLSVSGRLCPTFPFSISASLGGSLRASFAYLLPIIIMFSFLK